MSDYFQEMGWTPLGDGETPIQYLQLARFFRDFGAWELLDDREKLPPPASKEAVSELKDTEIKEKKKQCPVCILEFNIGAVVKTLPCSHSFHKECIIPWLEKTNSCPLCRYELPTDDEDYEDYKKEKKRAVERVKDIETLHNSMFS